MTLNLTLPSTAFRVTVFRATGCCPYENICNEFLDFSSLTVHFILFLIEMLCWSGILNVWVKGVMAQVICCPDVIPELSPGVLFVVTMAQQMNDHRYDRIIGPILAEGWL